MFHGRDVFRHRHNRSGSREERLPSLQEMQSKSEEEREKMKETFCTCCGQPISKKEKHPFPSFLYNYIKEMRAILGKIHFDPITEAAEALFTAWKENRQVFIMGNGGSASTASHMVNDLNKGTAVQNKKRFRAFCLNDNMSWLTALANDLDWSQVYEDQLRNYCQEGDCVVVFSTHGGMSDGVAGVRSQNLINALIYGWDNHGKTIAFTGFNGGNLKKWARIHVNVPCSSVSHTESIHLALVHCITGYLREKIASHEEK